MAVFAPRAGGPHHPPRAHPDGGQLERAVARPSGHAEPQRLPHQSGRDLQHALERRL
nr:hypothetical protein [Tanacetum cinerariifolium]